MNCSNSDKQRCWAKEGIWGNSTCVKLGHTIHCRNCEMFENEAIKYLGEPKFDCSEVVVKEKKVQTQKTCSLFIFKCADSVFAVEPSSVGEITSYAPIHRIPHRTGKAIDGISNINGDLVLVLNLYGTLNIGNFQPNDLSLMVLCKSGGEKFAFRADEVFGVRKICQCDIKTAENINSKFVSGVFDCKDVGRVLILDVQLLAGAILRRLI